MAWTSAYNVCAWRLSLKAFLTQSFRSTFRVISRTNKRYYKGKKMQNFDSGSTMSYPLALRININKKQTNKQTNRTSVLCLPWCWLALPSFLGPIAYHFILYYYYSKPIAFLSWLSYFGSIKPDITARFFGYLYRVYFQFFIYILKVCF